MYSEGMRRQQLLTQYNKQSYHTLGSQDPCNSPSRQSESLRKTIDDKNIIFINILDVFGGRNSSSVAVTSVVVARVKLIADQGGSATANVLNLGQLRVGNDSAGRVSGI